MEAAAGLGATGIECHDDVVSVYTVDVGHHEVGKSVPLGRGLGFFEAHFFVAGELVVRPRESYGRIVWIGKSPP